MPWLTLNAQASATATVTTSGLLNATPGMPISPGIMMPTAIAKITVTPSTSATLTSIRLDFGGTGFATTTDLAPISQAMNSGVAVFDDVTSPGTLGMGDRYVTSTPGLTWEPMSTTLIWTPESSVSLSSGVARTFFITIKAGVLAVNGHRINVTIPTGGIITSTGVGPTSPFLANEVVVDTLPPTIIGFEGSIGSPTTTVRFSEPVNSADGGDLRIEGSPLVYIHGGGMQTISNIIHTRGQDRATIVLSDNVTADDLDGSPSVIMAATNAVRDMGLTPAGDIAITPLSNPLRLTTTVIPTATAGATYPAPSPLVTFVGAGGTAPYVIAPADVSASSTMTSLGLSLGAYDGKLTGTATTTAGSFTFPVRILDALSASSVRMYTINIAGVGGFVPGISSVSPAGGAQGSSVSVSITGTNTTFSGASVVEFLMPIGVPGVSGVTAGSVTVGSPTSLSLTATIAGGAPTGPRDVRVTTGGQVVTLSSSFNVFPAAGAGLQALLPPAEATGVPIPPVFSFQQTAEPSVVTYRVRVKTTLDLEDSVTPIWDYAFTKSSSSSTSHCNASQCDVRYGVGNYRVIIPPTPLVASTNYYWQISAYAVPVGSITGEGVSPVESTPIRQFQTTGSVTDTSPPMVMHRPIFRAAASAPLSVFVKVFDNIGVENVKLFHCQGVSCSATNEVLCTAADSGFYTCTIPASALGIGSAGTITRYYVRASDGTNLTNFRQPDSSPFSLTAVAAGAGTISGTVTDSSGTCVSGVQFTKVFADGTGFETTTDGSCAFTLNGLPTGTYDLVAVKDGFGERHSDGISSGASGLGMRLTSGLTGGFGGDTTRPSIRASCPFDGSRSMPGGDSNFKICVVFSKAMNQTTINAAGNLTVRVIDLAGATTTNITTSKGSWTYYPTSPGIPGVPSESNMAVWSFNPGQTFGDDRTIAVRVSGDVTDSSGNAIQGNQSDGSYAFSFTTGRSFTEMVGFEGGTFGAGAFIPPHVIGSSPAPGAFGVPRNTIATINFSEGMADDADGYVMRTCLKLFAASDVTEMSILTTATLDASKRIASLTFPTLTASTQYRLKVLGSCRSSSGLTLGPPGSGATQTMYAAEFRTSATSDTTPPTVVGSYPDNGATGIPVGVGSVGVAFSRDMNPSSITADTVYLSIGSTVVNGTVDWRPLERRAVITPRTALSATTTYNLNVTTDVTALNGQALATAVLRTFTTGGADATSPSLSFMNVDDHAISLTFSEPMNTVTILGSASDYARSVLNPLAYNTIKYGAEGAEGFNPALTGTAISLSSARFSYDAQSHTVLIEGIDLSAARGREIYLSMDPSGPNQATDLSGNLLDSMGSSARARINSSATTGGALGPGAMNTSAFAGGGFVAANISTSAFGSFGQIEARPAQPQPGVISKYFLKIPISRQVPASGRVVLTFPSGFSTAAAQQDLGSPMRQDLNGPGVGTVTFKCLVNVAGGKSCAGTPNSDDTGVAQGGLSDDGVVVGDRTVTVYLSAATNAGGYDMLNVDLDGILNSGIPLDFNTSGYTVDIKTFSGNTLLESLTSRPFFLQSVGTQTVSGTITLPTNDQTCSVQVYLNSPSGGTQRATASFTGSDTAAYSFSNAPSGDVSINTDRFVTCGVGGSAKNYSGKSIPDRIFVPAAGPVVYNFSLTNADTGGTPVFVLLTGGVSQRLDLFAGSPANFVVRQITATTTPTGFTLRVPDGNYFLGVGPTIEPGSTGPPAATGVSYPRPQELRVQGGACTIDGVVGCSTAIVLASADKTIKGIVKDTSNRLMANVEVFAYSPGGFGGRAQTNSDGVFSIPAVVGTYTIAANISGLRSREANVRVTSDESAYLFIDAATTGITSAAASASFVLTIAKPDCSISGRVTDGTNVIQNAGVFAHRTDAAGQANGMTDSTGNYTLPVSCTGAWQVQSFAPGYGQMPAQSVTMAGSSQSSINFSPSLVGTFYTVSGAVTAGSAVQGAIVRITNGANFNEAVSDSSGNYSVRVPSGLNYTVRAFLPGVGESIPVGPFNVSDVTVNTGKDITLGALRTVTFNFSATMTEAFVDLIATDGKGAHADVRNATTTSLTVPNGSYEVRIGTPGLGLTRSSVAATTGDTTYNDSTGVVTVNGAEGLTVTLPTLRTFSGTVTNGSTPVGDAWVELVNATTNAAIGTKADSSGAFSLNVPNGTYRLNAMKPGYIRTPTSQTISTDTAGVTVILGQASTFISGTVRIGSTGVANAFVRAQRQGGGFTATQTDANGLYSLSVTDGIWSVSAATNGYAEQDYASNPLVVSGSSLTGKDITLTTVSTFAVGNPGSQTLSTSNGGTIEDTSSGIRLVVPPNAVASDGSDAIISYTETTNVPNTPSAHPLGAGFEFSAAGASGNQYNNFNDSITVEMSETPAELATQTARDGSALDTWTEVKDQVQLATFDSAANAWDQLATTITCVASDGTSIIDPLFLSSCERVTIAASAEHFSLYAPVIATDPAAPGVPTGFAGVAASVSQINLSWSAVSGATSYDIYRSDSLGGTYSRLGSEPTVASGATVSYSDTGLATATTYYYKITAINASGESEGSAPITVVTASVVVTPSRGGGGSAGGSASGGQSIFTLGQTPSTVIPRPVTPAPPVIGPVLPVVPTAPVLSPVIPPVAPAKAAPSVSPAPSVKQVQAVVGGNVVYTYDYRNAGKVSQKIRVERVVTDAKGKIVKRAFADVVVKPGQKWQSAVKDVVPTTWKAGAYQTKIIISDAKTKKQLQRTDVTIVVKPAPPKPKPVPKPAPKKVAPKLSATKK